MGMSTHIKAFVPDTDPEFVKHKEVLLACNKAGVSLPKETAEYFSSKEPEPYVLDEKLSVELKEGAEYVKWGGESSDGFEIDLTKLPKGVTKLRFYNSW